MDVFPHYLGSDNSFCGQHIISQFPQESGTPFENMIICRSRSGTTPASHCFPINAPQCSKVSISTVSSDLICDNSKCEIYIPTRSEAIVVVVFSGGMPSLTRLVIMIELRLVALLFDDFIQTEQYFNPAREHATHVARTVCIWMVSGG